MDDRFLRDLKKIAGWLGYCVSNFWFDINCNGLKNIPKEGPAIILPTHMYTMDIPLIAGALYKAGRTDVVFWIKQGLFRYLTVLENFGYPIARLKDIDRIKEKYPSLEETARKESARMLRAALKSSIEVLNDDGIVLTFPEGTRNPKQIGPCMRGFQSLIYHLQKERDEPLPLIPVGFNYHNGPGYDGQLYGGNVDVNIGEAMYMNDRKSFSGELERILRKSSSLKE